jgi:GABA(A) receptor-associated protein
MRLASSEKRKQEAERIRQKYPDRIPVSLPLLFLATSSSLIQECHRS